jgi:hypothetical protein
MLCNRQRCQRCRYALPPRTSACCHPCSETWIVMDLMDRGTLASAVRRGMFVDPADTNIRAVSCQLTVDCCWVCQSEVWQRSVSILSSQEPYRMAGLRMAQTARQQLPAQCVLPTSCSVTVATSHCGSIAELLWTHEWQPQETDSECIIHCDSSYCCR